MERIWFTSLLSLPILKKAVLLVGAPFAFRMPAAAIDIGSLFHGLALGAAVFFRRDARANGVCALMAFFGVHASLP
jgi:hypothetical protein